VFRAVQAAEERRMGRQPPGAPPPPLSVPRLFAYQPHCTPLRRSGPPVRAGEDVEFMVLEKCGVDLSALRYDWQSRTATAAGGSLVHAPLALELGVLCLKALEQFHRAGFVHRDIKPSNFLTCFDPNEWTQRVLLTDFGLSRHRDALAAAAQAPPSQGSNADNQFIGKSLYASFAAHRQQAQRPRDDVVSLLFVLLDLMCGDLPWKSLATGAGGDKRSQAQRWDVVLAEKERLLGVDVCSAAQHALQQNASQPPCSWLPSCPLPPQIRIIFHSLHSLPSDALPDYAGIRSQLQRLSHEVREQLRQANQQAMPLQQLLQLRADDQARAAATEARRLRELEDARQAEERRAEVERQRAEVERQRAEQDRVDREKKQLAHQQYLAKMQQQKDAAAAAQERQAGLALQQQQRQQWAAASAQAAALARSAPQMQMDKQHRAVLDRLPPRPPAFSNWSRRVRDFLGQLLQLDSSLPVLDMKSTTGAASVPASTSSLALHSLWDRLSWSEVIEAAVSGRALMKVSFTAWKGDWNELAKGLHLLSPEQLSALLAHFSQASTPLPAQLANVRGEDKFLLVGVPLNIAWVYEVAQQAQSRSMHVAGWNAPVPAPLVPAKVAAKAAAPSRAETGAAPPAKVRLVKKVTETVNLVDGAAAPDVAASAAPTPAAPAAAAPATTAAIDSKAAQAKPAVKTEASKSASAKPEPAKPKPPSTAAAAPSSSSTSAAPSAGKKPAIFVNRIKQKPVLARARDDSSSGSSSSSCSDDSSSSSSDSDTDEPLVQSSKGKLLKASKAGVKSKTKDKEKKSAAAVPTASSTTPPKRRLKKVMVEDDEEEEDEEESSAAPSDEESEDELSRLKSKNKRQLASEEIKRRRQAEKEAAEAAQRAEEEKHELRLWPSINSKITHNLAHLPKPSEFAVPNAWQPAPSPTSEPESSEAEDADEDKMALRAAFDRYPSTMALWAWGDDYGEWDIHMRDMLDRALVLDTLADMGDRGVKAPKSEAELDANFLDRLNVPKGITKAPYDNDPMANVLHKLFLKEIEQEEAASNSSSSSSSEEEEKAAVLAPMRTKEAAKSAKKESETAKAPAAVKKEPAPVAVKKEPEAVKVAAAAKKEPTSVKKEPESPKARPPAIDTSAAAAASAASAPEPATPASVPETPTTGGRGKGKGKATGKRGRAVKEEPVEEAPAHAASEKLVAEVIVDTNKIPLAAPPAAAAAPAPLTVQTDDAAAASVAEGASTPSTAGGRKRRAAAPASGASAASKRGTRGAKSQATGADDDADAASASAASSVAEPAADEAAGSKRKKPAEASENKKEAAAEKSRTAKKRRT